MSAIPGSVPRIRSFYGPWDVEGFVEDTALLKSTAPWRRPILLARAFAKRHYRHSVEAQNLRTSLRTVILSEQTRSEVAAFGYAADHVVKIPGGVNRDRYFVDTDDPGARHQAREKSGLPTEAYPLLLSIRRLVPRMGLENLIAAFPAVRRRFPKAHLVIGGRGPLMEPLQAMAGTFGVADATTFAGFIPDELVADYYRGADLFVLPTLSLEGFGLVTVESLSCGTPVVATPVGATPEVLGDLEPRLLTRGTDSVSLSEAILAFCEAQERGEVWARELTAERLRIFVDDRYTWARHAAAVETVYRSVLQP